jgi:hypothetical protein
MYVVENGNNIFIAISVIIGYYDLTRFRYRNGRRRPCLYLSYQPPVRGMQRRRDTPSPHPSPDRGRARSQKCPQVPQSEPCCFSEIVQQNTPRRLNFVHKRT